jgi:hypothetical protein
MVLQQPLKAPGTVRQISDGQSQVRLAGGDGERAGEHGGTGVAREGDEDVAVQIRAAAGSVFEPPIGIPELAVIVDIEVFEGLRANDLPGDDENAVFEVRAID